MCLSTRKMKNPNNVYYVKTCLDKSKLKKLNFYCNTKINDIIALATMYPNIGFAFLTFSSSLLLNC